MPTDMDDTKREMTESYTFQSISSSHFTFLRMSSFLALENKSFSHPLSLLLQLWDHLIVTLYTMSWIVYGICMILRRQVEIDYICEQMVVLGFFLRYVLLCFKRKQLRRLIESCERLWNQLEVGEDVVVRQLERKGYYLRNFITLNTLMVVTSYVVTAQFTRLPPLEANGTERRALPFRFFMELEEKSAFIAVYIMQTINGYFIVFMYASVETVSLYLIMMACGYLQSLRNRLLNFTEIKEDDPREQSAEAEFKFIVKCAHFHQQIMIFCNDVDRMTQTLFLFACFFPVYNMSITGLKILDSDEDLITYATVMFLNLFQFFSCQWAPEFLIIESEAIAKAAYFASFKSQAPSHREKINWILRFMMMRAQKPIQLTAGGFINLSMQTFGAMLKSAFSFFAVLRSF